MRSWIAHLVRLKRTGNTFHTSAAFGSGPRLFGGLIAAQSLAAAGATVEPGRPPQSLHGYFIRGGKVGVDIEFTVEVTRDGRSFNTRRVTASQDGAAIFEMLASFHRPEPTTDWQRSIPPRLALADAQPITTLPERWADHFEARMSPGITSDWPKQPFWFRSHTPIEDDPLLRACALTFVSDIGLVSAARPPGGTQSPGPGGAASLDHALWFHRPVDPHQWHLYDAVAVNHSDARGLAQGSITDEAGVLVASVTQESLWRP
jgi:acyl-CoA thioesterase II